MLTTSFWAHIKRFNILLYCTVSLFIDDKMLVWSNDRLVVYFAVYCLVDVLSVLFHSSMHMHGRTPFQETWFYSTLALNLSPRPSLGYIHFGPWSLRSSVTSVLGLKCTSISVFSQFGPRSFRSLGPKWLSQFGLLLSHFGPVML